MTRKHPRSRRSHASPKASKTDITSGVASSGVVSGAAISSGNTKGSAAVSPNGIVVGPPPADNAVDESVVFFTESGHFEKEQANLYLRRLRRQRAVKALFLLGAIGGAVYYFKYYLPRHRISTVVPSNVVPPTTDGPEVPEKRNLIPLIVGITIAVIVLIGILYKLRSKFRAPPESKTQPPPVIPPDTTSQDAAAAAAKIASAYKKDAEKKAAAQKAQDVIDAAAKKAQEAQKVQDAINAAAKQAQDEQDAIDAAAKQATKKQPIKVELYGTYTARNGGQMANGLEFFKHDTFHAIKILENGVERIHFIPDSLYKDKFKSIVNLSKIVGTWAETKVGEKQLEDKLKELQGKLKDVKNKRNNQISLVDNDSIDSVVWKETTKPKMKG